MKLQMKGLTHSAKTVYTKKLQQIKSFVSTYPFATIFTLLIILLILIMISSRLRKPAEEKSVTTLPPKMVRIYRIGTTPRLTIQAQIEKSGVITVSAQTPGIVSHIGVQPGDKVQKGRTLLTLSTTYQGASAPAIQASLAYQQLKHAEETFDTQKEIIAKQREVASKVDDNTNELRNISAKSLDETRASIALNDEIISGLDAQIQSGTNVDMNRQLKSQFLGANNQLKSMLRATEYSSSSDKIPADLSHLQKDITMKSLDIQEKALTLQKEIARLSYQLALVAQQAMSPTSPFNGVVQKVFVRPGQSVNPGAPLVLLSQTAEEDPITATAYVPQEVAQRISYSQPSILSIQSFEIKTYPTFISQDAVKGSLYAVYFAIPDNYSRFLTDNTYINVSVPVGQLQTGVAFPYIPIDAVYQNESSSYVFVQKDNLAVNKIVKLGPLFGSFVQVIDGLGEGDAVILDRTVSTGDKIIASSK